MVNCGACGKFLSSAGAASCSVCPTKYHRACLAIADKTQISKDWVCPGCKRHVRRGDNSQTPVKGIGEDGDCGVPLPVSSPPAPPRVACAGPALVADGGAALEAAAPAGSVGAEGISEFRREFAECISEMREFRKEMVLLRESFAAFTVRLDGVEQRLEALERGQTGGDSARVAELEQSVSALKQELNEREQDALLSDLEVGHLPEEKGENVVHAVMVLAGRLGVPLEERDVVFAERVGVRPEEAAGRPRRVVVRLASRRLRDDLLQAARVRRGLTGSTGGRVYINERLTRTNRQLFNLAREECKKLRWRYSWTKRGRVYVRQADGSPAHQLRSCDDVERVLGSHNISK